MPGATSSTSSNSCGTAKRLFRPTSHGVPGREVLEAVRDSGGVALCAFGRSLVGDADRTGMEGWHFDVYPTCEGMIAAAPEVHLEDP